MIWEGSSKLQKGIVNEESRNINVNPNRYDNNKNKLSPIWTSNNKRII